MKLSFIVPYFNKPTDVLLRCLRSIKTQALKDWEVVLVKDGPSHVPDRVIENVFDHSDKVRVIEIEKGGACAARNAGFKESTGDYVVFWDADCAIEPEVAKQWCDFLDKNKDYGFVYSGYRFTGEGGGGIASEAFDPWTLRVRNYISACFPVRRELVKGWDTNLKSLQDWDFWLSVVEAGAKGKFIEGFAFSTTPPDKDSISGQGCTDEVWLSRVDAVKKKHNLPERKMCVSAPMHRMDGLSLAKAIDADYQDFPEFKPHRYETIIKIGFSLERGRGGWEANTLKNPNVKDKYLFWTPEDIMTLQYRTSLKGLKIYSLLLNSICAGQFVEDKISCDMMKEAGFNVEVFPLPMRGSDAPMPNKPKWVLDISDEYEGLATSIINALPDIEVANLHEVAKIDDFSGIVQFYPDALLNSTMKRLLVSGRNVVSNIKSPFCGFVKGDKAEELLKPVVNAIRSKSENCDKNLEAMNYWREELKIEKFTEKLNARQLCNSKS